MIVCFIMQQQKLSLSDFEVIRNLGDGAYGDVYLVKYLKTQQEFAMKQIDKEHIAKYQKKHHVFKEKLILEKVHSKYIAKLVGTFQDENSLYFLLEYLPYGDLS